MGETYRDDRPTMSEFELLARFVENMRLAEECARGLAHSRKDMRWFRISQLINGVREKAADIAGRRLAS